MDNTLTDDYVMAERCRVQAEYQRRQQSIAHDRYAPWKPDVLFTRSQRSRLAASMLHASGAFPRFDEQCLEIGYGSQGWLGDLICWGVAESSLHGIELDPARASLAQRLLPNADLRVGDATELPWPDEHFRVVIASTLFTSVLDDRVRQLLANEVQRTLQPGGVLLWYDFAVNNPRNSNVRRIDRRELKQLFPLLNGHIRSTTLAMPIARRVAPMSWLAATCLESIPFLRTHLIGVLQKPDSPNGTHDQT